jgi:SAM-dependent methyltransferase
LELSRSRRGGGTIAAWLGERVGADGHVLVTDLDPRFLDCSKLPNLEVRRHNVATVPVPEAAFDLIHSRPVLIYLPERQKVLARLIAALRPGGWLVVEDFDSRSLPSDPLLNSGEIQLKTQTALYRVVEDAGLERRWGRLLYGRMRALGQSMFARRGVFPCGREDLRVPPSRQRISSNFRMP